MAKHKQPTKDELQEKIDEATKISEEDLAKVGEGDADNEEEQPVAQEEPQEETQEETPQEEQPQEETPQEEQPQEETTEEEEVPAEEENEELKKKFSASSREAQKLLAKNRVITKAIIDAEEAPEPTEEELMEEYPDWDVMSDTEKKFAKETVVSRNWRTQISKAKEQATKIEKWNEDVDKYIEDPKTLVDNPELEGKLEKFKDFATKEENNNVPKNILVGAFLHEEAKAKPSTKGKMFETGGGGPPTKPPGPKKLSVEQSRQLRESDYGEWKRQLQLGNISDEF